MNLKSGHILKGKRIYLFIAILAFLIIVVDGIIIIAGVLTRQSHDAFIKTINTQSNQKSTTQNDQLGSKNPSIEQPSDSQLANYQAPSDHPKYLVIPKLGINTRIIQKSLTSDGSIDVPTTGYDTVWYSGSSLPGKSGATFIDGHVDGYADAGVFYYLKTLSPGDTISIVKGDNTTLHYVVKKLTTYDADKVDMKQVLSPIDPTKPGLNLMTCTGTLIDHNTSFNKRVVVFSVLEN